MKKIICVILIAVICLSFSSCELSFVSVDNLMRPPKLSGESRHLQAAFEETMNGENSFIIKNPISGENRSSYLFFDIDNDGVEEGIVFYSEISSGDATNVSIFKKNNNQWSRVSEIKGRGEEVYEIDFADVNGDNRYEILISWTFLSEGDKSINNAFSNLNERMLTVYSYSGSSVTVLKTEYFTKLFVNDFNGDKSDEILILNIDLSSIENRTTGKIVRFDEDYSVNDKIGFTLSGMLDIVGISMDSGRHNGENSELTNIYIDGTVSENNLITEVISINKDNFDVTLPLYGANTSEHPPTIRSSKILCRDIDNDTVIEIPTFEALPGGVIITDEQELKSSQLFLTVWSEIGEDGMKPNFKCLYNGTYNYLFKFPQEWENKVTAMYNNNSANLIFYSLDENGQINEKILTFRAFSNEDWQKNGGRYEKITENGVFVYGCIYNSISSAEADEYINNFIIID